MNISSLEKKLKKSESSVCQILEAIAVLMKDLNVEKFVGLKSVD